MRAVANGLASPHVEFNRALIGRSGTSWTLTYVHWDGMDMTDVSCGITAMGYSLPKQRVSVDELAASGRTSSPAEKLRALGYRNVYVAERDGESVEEMALAAIHDLEIRSGFDLSKIDLMLYGGALPTSHIIGEENWYGARDARPLFRYPGTWLQHQLRLPNMQVMGVGQMACNSLHACLRMARGLFASEPVLEHILCVVSDSFPAQASREVVFNLMSDGACALVVSRHAERNRLIACCQITRGVYWDGKASHDRLVAAYFPLVKACVGTALGDAGWAPDEIDLFVPHNINHESWKIAASIIGIPLEKIYTGNIARIGHVVGADNLINHLSALDEGRIVPGQKLAWFVTGFGAHWSCTLFET